MKQIAFFILLFLSLSGINNYMSAQDIPVNAAEYQIIIENISRPDPNTYEFDLELLNVNPRVPFELALFQTGIYVNPEFFAGGKVTASIVPGSSGLVEEQQPLAITFAMDQNIIKLPSRTLKPLPKDAVAGKQRGTLISAKIPGTRICRIQLKNTVPFTKAPANLKFSFTKIPYGTNVSRYIDAVNTPLPCTEKNVIIKL